MLRIEFFSDPVCPFCYIGKRRLESALARFEHRERVEIVWRSFQLDPTLPTEASETLLEREVRVYDLTPEAAKARLDVVAEMAVAEGLDYHLDRALPVNSLDAHRLLHHAAAHGKAAEMAERVMRAYTAEGRSIADRPTLCELAADAGLDPVQARRILDSNEYAEAVEADCARAADLGVHGVPAAVIDGTYFVSGAAPATSFLEALDLAWSQQDPAQPGSQRPPASSTTRRDSVISRAV